MHPTLEKSLLMPSASKSPANNEDGKTEDLSLFGLFLCKVSKKNGFFEKVLNVLPKAIVLRYD